VIEFLAVTVMLVSTAYFILLFCHVQLQHDYEDAEETVKDLQAELCDAYWRLFDANNRMDAMVLRNLEKK
jgi:hypothetical protein